MDLHTRELALAVKKKGVQVDAHGKMKPSIVGSGDGNQMPGRESDCGRPLPSRTNRWNVDCLQKTHKKKTQRQGVEGPLQGKKGLEKASASAMHVLGRRRDVEWAERCVKNVKRAFGEGLSK